MSLKKKIIKNSLNNIISLYVAIAFTAIATILATNMNFIYKLIINNLDLPKVSGVNSDRIMADYKVIISYLQNPFMKKLELNDFGMSKYGYIHFFEVKKIFIALICISLIFILMLFLLLIFNYKYKKINISSIVKIFNKSFNILIAFIITIFVAINLNFSKAFTIFHKIFFRNDYWILDPKTDPIIKVLPQEVFLIYGVVIITIILSIVVIGKIFCNKNISI